MSPLAAVPGLTPFREAVLACVDELAEQDEAQATILQAPYLLVRALRRTPEPPTGAEATGPGTGR